jgi:hypothetical protein
MGKSWITTLFGWIMIVGDLADLVNDTIISQGIPTSISGWIQFAVVLSGGIGLVFAKDYNKSNSPHPVPVSVAVPDPSNVPTPSQ